MNKFLPLFLLLGFLKSATGQITVTSNDFAAAGQNIPTSTAYIPGSLSYQQSGPNATWDFSSLKPASQTSVQILDPSGTGTVYSATFGYLTKPPSNIALTGSNVNIDLLGLYTLSFTDVYNFYNINPQAYVQVGWGGTSQNIQLPTIFTNLDTLYHFPVNYGNTDSCFSGFALNGSGFIYFSETQTRVDTVDGWGELTTPYGTFPVIRMVTDLFAYDTLFVDTLHLGSGTLTHTRQYKWIGNNQGEPLLQINTTPHGSQESISSITYKDSLRNLSGVTPLSSDGFEFNVYPNPAHSVITINCASNANEYLWMTVTDIQGKTILESALSGEKEYFDIAGWAKGIYFVTVGRDNQKLVKKLVLN